MSGIGHNILAFHSTAGIFQLLTGKEFKDLVDDIRKMGLITPIWLHTDGSILDGRNRYLACFEAGVEPKFQQWDGVGFAADFVWSLNYKRRHLDGNERKMAAGRYSIELEREAAERSGMRTDLTSVSNDTEVEFAKSREIAAEKFNESPATVARAVKVIKEGAVELIQAVERGEVSVSAAADIATLDMPIQSLIVARGEKEILEAAKQIRAERAIKSTQIRIEKIAEISRGNIALGTGQTYPVIYADPPWRYELPPMGGSNRAIENHYPTMSLEEICALPVGDLATDDAILYLWATSPKLAECMKVIEAWGFEYRTNFVWVKDKIGMGYHNRNQHELLLVCRRGNIPPPAVADRVSSVVYADRTEHSVKPTEFYELIESFYPILPKIELFNRSPREGWSVWGNQSEVA